jgi:hypothetical protein
MMRFVMNRYLLRFLSAMICFVFGVVSSLVLQVSLPRVATQEQLKAQAYEQGRREAEFDLSQDRLLVRTYRMPVVWDGPDLYAEHLSNDYGIKIVRVANCVVNDFLAESTRGYNDTMLPVIESRYGKGILERVHEQAVAEWRRTHQ